MLNEIDEVASMMEGGAQKLLADAARLENAAHALRERAKKLMTLADDVRALVDEAPSGTR